MKKLSVTRSVSLDVSGCLSMSNAEGDVRCVEYQSAVGGIAHIGDLAHAGHYRAFSVLPRTVGSTPMAAQLGSSGAVGSRSVHRAPGEEVDLVNPKKFPCTC